MYEFKIIQKFVSLVLLIHQSKIKLINNYTFFLISQLWEYLQYVADYTKWPHVSREGHWFIVDDFRGTELCRSKENLDRFSFFKTLSQSEVDDLYVCAVFGDTHDVLWLWTEWLNYNKCILLIKSIIHSCLIYLWSMKQKYANF